VDFTKKARQIALAPERTEGAMKLYGCRVFVDDLHQARTFYGETLGLAVKWDYGTAIGYDVGADLIVEAFDQDEEEEYPDFLRDPGGFLGISLQVDDIDASYRELSARGVRFISPPQKMPWGGTLAHFKDPSGNVLTLLG
jgi:catechol 2,3-dioxygenase-like lactoylglutathione lyase family enzyme